MSIQEKSGIDPRGPRFGAAITSVLLLITVFLGLDKSTQDAGFVLLAIIDALFLIGAALGNTRHPYGLIFKKFVRPRLSAPKELEDPRPPQFAQTVGFLVASLGLVTYAFGFSYGVALFAGFAFVAAFLNAAFAFCLGCQIWLGLRRIGVIRG
ncbi:MAG: DUF4395 domain-containing protein [Micrococcales bacterium]